MSRLALGTPVRRILVIRRKALGDCLVTLPAVLELARAFPRADLDLVIDRPFASLLGGLARGVRVLPWPPERPASGWWRRLRGGRYDLVLDYLGSPRTALWTAVTGARLRVGYDLRGRRWAYNVRVARNRLEDTGLMPFAGESFLDPLRALGLSPPPWRPAGCAAGWAPGESLLGESYRAWHRQWRPSRPRVGLVFSATWSAKAWPVEHVVQLHRLLIDAGASPLQITGPGDEELAAVLRRELPASDLAPPTTLTELADLLSGLDLWIGTDNGVRHLAQLIGLPTLTLFGPTDPRGWNPPGRMHVALRTGEPCSPCDLTICPVPGHPCLARLEPAHVLLAARRLWEAGRRRCGREREGA
jgi:heptosyltransferase-1